MPTGHDATVSLDHVGNHRGIPLDDLAVQGGHDRGPPAQVLIAGLQHKRAPTEHRLHQRSTRP